MPYIYVACLLPLHVYIAHSNIDLTGLYWPCWWVSTFSIESRCSFGIICKQLWPVNQRRKMIFHPSCSPALSHYRRENLRPWEVAWFPQGDTFSEWSELVLKVRALNWSVLLYCNVCLSCSSFILTRVEIKYQLPFFLEQIN